MKRVSPYVETTFPKYLGLYLFHKNTLDGYLRPVHAHELQKTITILDQNSVEEDSDLSQMVLAESCGQLARIYFESGAFDKSLIYIRKGEAAYEKIMNTDNPFQQVQYDKEMIDRYKVDLLLKSGQLVEAEELCLRYIKKYKSPPDSSSWLPFWVNRLATYCKQKGNTKGFQLWQTYYLDLIINQKYRISKEDIFQSALHYKENKEYPEAAKWCFSTVSAEVLEQESVSEGLNEYDLIRLREKSLTVTDQVITLLAALPINTGTKDYISRTCRLLSKKEYTLNKLKNIREQSMRIPLYAEYIALNCGYAKMLEDPAPNQDSLLIVKMKIDQLAEDLSKLTHSESVSSMATFERLSHFKSDEIFISIHKLPQKYVFILQDSTTHFLFLKTDENALGQQFTEQNTKAIYKSFWKLIEPYIGKKEKLYVAPDGGFNQLSFAGIQLADSRYLLDKYDIEIVSSIDEIFEKKVVISPGKIAVLLGAPNFKLTPDKQKALALKYTTSYTETPLFGAADVARDRLTPLIYARREVNNIGSMLKQQGFQVSTFVGDDCLEEAVKAVKSPRILHIATHGYFAADVKPDSTKANETFLGMQRRIVSGNPLLRSGLFFAGAERTLNGQRKPGEKAENGILTAYEALNLDLTNTELVVLSACETGLGQIQNGEGVYGLQRAFRMAGARSVLMSLWKVDDQATQILMENFYKFWLVDGHSKHQALKKAQQVVRAIPGKEAPEFWAAFVLIGE